MRAALPLLLLSLAARAQTLPAGVGRFTLHTLFVHQELPNLDAPHLLTEASASDLLRSLGATNDPTSVGFLTGRDLALLTPGISFSGTADALVNAPQIDFGITDRLTATLIWPWFDYAQTNPHLSVSGNAFGYNIDYTARKPASIDNFPVILPATSGSSGRAVTGTEGVQQFLSSFLGYRRLERWRDHGTGDPALALSYAALQRSDVTLVTTAWGQIPLGQVADPDNPLAIPFSDGHVKLGARALLEDREARPLLLSLGLGWVYQFVDHPVMRIYRYAAIPIAAADTEERVTRHPGQQLQATMAVAREFLSGLLRPAMTVGWQHEFADSIRGKLAPEDYAAVVSNTGRNVFSAEAGCTISTVAGYLKQRFALPAEVTLGLRYQVADHGLFGGLPQVQASLEVSTFF